MSEAEIRKLFMVIRNYYSFFSYDDFTVVLWKDALRDIPYDHAMSNLKWHVRTGKFPPTVAELAAGMVSSPEGRYIPNAEETRAYLAEQAADRQKVLQMPTTDTRRLKLVEPRPTDPAG